MTAIAASGTRAAVPAYFHPSWAGEDWARLCETRPRPPADIVVINPDSGVGGAPDAGYHEVSSRLRAAGVTVAGYVDTAYQGRRAQDVLAETLAYRIGYGLDTVFLDQVSSDRSGLIYYRQLSEALAAMAMRLILNPGTTPEPAYLEIAEVVVTFEGPWEAYRSLRPVPAARSSRAATWHLVHSTPPAHHERVVGHLRRHGVDFGYVTDATMPNPWDRLPLRWSLPGRNRCRGEG